MGGPTPASADGELTGRLSRIPLRDQVVEVLRDMVISGPLRPGDRINEAELAGRLGISRGPLREAIQRLSAEGFIDFQQNRGAFVRTVTLDDVRHLYELREVIEVKAAMLVASRGTDAHIAQLQELLVAVRKELRRNSKGGYPVNFDVHELIFTLAGNPYLRRVGLDLEIQVRLARARSGSSPERARQALHEHDRMISAIADRDADRAAAATAEHLRSSLNHLIEIQDTL